ncbi:hypothetical protein BYT27DRAFT_7125228 [Phlegmacium glaucopus]|nr:hypothetical protein BYT27DRAFT_7125228 [Phlegmacium glaucopus]
MTESHQASSPIIPVIDERLAYQASAPADHKIKVDKYNELLEDIYQREVELTKIRSALVAMREEIAEETRILDGTNNETRDAVKDEEEKDEDDNGKEAEQLSDSSSEKGKKKNYKKTKGKGKGHIKRSKMADSELDAEWDYKLELIRSGSVKKERRASDASEKEVEMVPLRPKAGVMSASH